MLIINLTHQVFNASSPQANQVFPNYDQSVIVIKVVVGAGFGIFVLFLRFFGVFLFPFNPGVIVSPNSVNFPIDVDIPLLGLARFRGRIRGGVITLRAGVAHVFWSLTLLF